MMHLRCPIENELTRFAIFTQTPTEFDLQKPFLIYYQYHLLTCHEAAHDSSLDLQGSQHLAHDNPSNPKEVQRTTPSGCPPV